MGISLLPVNDVTVNSTADEPPKKKPTTDAPAGTFSLAGVPPVNASAAPAPMTTTPALPTEYPSAPSTTGVPQNRLQLAQNAFDTFAKSTEPQYAADLRLATQAAAGKGQIGSGGLRTTYGNLANQRALALDTQRDNLINSALTGTISDQQTADANALARYSAETGRLGTTGNLALGQGSLTLEQQKAATAANQGQQSLDLAKKTAEQNYGLSQAQLDLQTKLGLGNLSVEQQRTEIARQQAETEAKYQAGQLSLAERNAKLAELTQATNATQQQEQIDLAKKAQADSQTNEQARLQLAKDQLAQQGQQFGLTLAQQKELATMADKTANRQLDVSSAQGQNSLLLELARIMGTSTSNIDPSFLAAIAKSLGLAQAPNQTNGSTTTTSTTGTKTTGTTGTATGQRPV